MEVTNHPILLIEDSEDDIYFMQRAFKSAGIVNPLSVVKDGLEALRYLQRAGEYADPFRASRPGLILLDLKLPGMPGLEVLRWITERKELATVPVIVLTSSNQPKDIEAAFGIGAHSYLVKPSNAQKLTKLVTAVKDYWLEHDNFHQYTPQSGTTGARLGGRY